MSDLLYDPAMPRFDEPSVATPTLPSTPCGMALPILPIPGFPGPALSPADLLDVQKLLRLLGLTIPISEPSTVCPAVTEAALAGAVASWSAGR